MTAPRRTAISSAASISCALLLAVACQQQPADESTSAGVKSATKKTAPATPAKPASSLSGSRLAKDQVVVTWNGGTLTYGQMQDAAKAEFRKLANKHARELYDLELSQADQQVTKSLVDAAAKKAGKSTDDFLREFSGPAEVSQADIQAFYDKTVKSSGQPLDDAMKMRIQQYLGQQGQQEQIKKAIDKIRDAAGMKIDVPAPPFDKANFDLTDRPMMGNPDAKVTIVEFSDFECPYCSRATPLVKALLTAYPNDVKIYFMHFPLGFHKAAMPAAIASRCAQKQGQFWKMHDLLFESQKTLTPAKFMEHAKAAGIDMAKFEACLSDPAVKAFVHADMKQGEAAGVNGTPSVFVNGLLHPRGVPTVQDLEKHVRGS